MARKPKAPNFAEPPRGADPEWDLNDVSETWHLFAARSTDPRNRAIATVLDALNDLAASPDEATQVELVRAAETLLRKRHGHVPIPKRRELAERVAEALESDLRKRGEPMPGAGLAPKAVMVLESQCSEDLANFEAKQQARAVKTNATQHIAEAIDRVNARNRIAGHKFDPQDLAEAYTKAIFRALDCKVAANVLSGRNKQRTTRDPVDEELDYAAEARRAIELAKHPDMVAARERRLRDLEAKFGVHGKERGSRD